MNMSKAVFLLCPADHLCPSQAGGLDLDYYYSVSRLDPLASAGRLEGWQSTADFLWMS